MNNTCTHLERCNPDKGMSRFYAASVQPSLFGWSLVRQWGRIGTRGQMNIDLHDSEDQAQAAYGKLIREKVRRGYL